MATLSRLRERAGRQWHRATCGGGPPCPRLSPQVVCRQIWQDLPGDGVVAEGGFVLFEAKAPQPIPDVHDGSLIPRGAMIAREEHAV